MVVQVVDATLRIVVKVGHRREVYQSGRAVSRDRSSFQLLIIYVIIMLYSENYAYYYYD